MPKLIPPLTDTAIRQAKPSQKPRRLFDGRVTGLHLLIQPSGAKLWRLRYTINSEEKRMALGKYPEISLEEVRKQAAEHRKQIAQGNDPAAPATVNTFAVVAEKFIVWKSTVLLRAGATIRKYRECLKNDLLPVLGDKDIADIHPVDVVPLLEQINKRSNNLARKNLELVSMIVKYAILQGYRPPYSHLDLSGAIPRKPSKPKNIPRDPAAVFASINKYPESVMRMAMKLQFLGFLRASETMGAEWKEFDLKKKEWHIPAQRMKMKRPHVVPLAKQTISLLRELKKSTGETPYLFPSLHSDAPMCRDALSKAFRSAGIGIVPHHCRTLAGTWLKNNKFAPHLVEAQLSHVNKNEVAGAYEHEPHLMYLDERKQMMQVWANCLIPAKSI